MGASFFSGRGLVGRLAGGLLRAVSPVAGSIGIVRLTGLQGARRRRDESDRGGPGQVHCDRTGGRHAHRHTGLVTYPPDRPCNRASA
ncbi:hypothetical protein BSLA_02r2783 [Burkholderia stabilis]|nr:hypothetical protein BSLA_02r2783 [Burkholderia stabilis]